MDTITQKQANYTRKLSEPYFQQAEESMQDEIIRLVAPEDVKVELTSGMQRFQELWEQRFPSADIPKWQASENIDTLKCNACEYVFDFVGQALDQRFGESWR